LTNEYFNLIFPDTLTRYSVVVSYFGHLSIHVAIDFSKEDHSQQMT
jgi:hypothetical protein